MVRFLKFARHLSFQLFFLMALLLIVIFSFYMFITLRLHTSHLMESVMNNAISTSDIIKRSTRYSMLQNHNEEVLQIITTISNAAGVDGIRIYNKKGVIMVSSKLEEMGKAMDMRTESCYVCHSQQVPIESLPSQNQARLFRSQEGYRVLGLINPIYNEPDCYNSPCHAHSGNLKILGVLDVKMSLQQVDKHLEESRRQMIIYAVLFIVALVVVCGGFIRIMVHKPVAALIEGTRQIANGNLSYEIALTSKNEIGQLAKSFNSMVYKLGQAYEEITNWSKTLELKVREKTEELEKTQSRIIQMEKMASLGKLSATVAHEINNPLAGILNYAKLILKKIPKLNIEAEQTESIQQYLGVIESESKRCGKIVKDLLLFAKSAEGEFQEKDVREIIDKSLLLVSHHLEIQGVNLEKTFPEEKCLCLCEPNQIQQALMALFINSVEAMPAGGILKVEAFTVDSKGMVRIRVADTGKGIPPEILSNIFEPFFTTKKGGTGVGLGLSVVYGIIQRHKGDISVESKVNEGTTFSITLPMNAEVALQNFHGISSDKTPNSAEKTSFQAERL